MPSQRGSSSPRGRRAETRLIEAVTRVVAREGYGRLTVATLLRAAPASRATFYQYFANVEDCFLSAYRQHAKRLVSDVAAAVERRGSPALATFDVLVDLAFTEPEVARLLMTEGLAAGPPGLKERDVLIETIAQTLTGARQGYATDLAPAVLIGGAFRFLSMRLAEDDLGADLREELRAWASAFASSEPSWSARFTPPLPREASEPPSARRPFRPAGPARDRILHATAATVRQKGYRAVTVDDIVGAAGASRRLFYNEFPSKADAFIAAYEHTFQQSLAACAPAFFSSSAWPERVWDSGLAFTSYVAREPWFAHLGFVECYSVGREFVPRVHDTQLAFTLFLEEGYRQRPEAQSLPRSFAALTATAIFEAGFQGSRRGSGLYIRRLHPLAVYIALASFIGLDAAGEFVADKLATYDQSEPPPT